MGGRANCTYFPCWILIGMWREDPHMFLRICTTKVVNVVRASFHAPCRPTEELASTGSRLIGECWFNLLRCPFAVHSCSFTSHPLKEVAWSGISTHLRWLADTSWIIIVRNQAQGQETCPSCSNMFTWHLFSCKMLRILWIWCPKTKMRTWGPKVVTGALLVAESIGSQCFPMAPAMLTRVMSAAVLLWPATGEASASESGNRCAFQVLKKVLCLHHPPSLHWSCQRFTIWSSLDLTQRIENFLSRQESITFSDGRQHHEVRASYCHYLKKAHLQLLASTTCRTATWHVRCLTSLRWSLRPFLPFEESADNIR